MHFNNLIIDRIAKDFARYVMANPQDVKTLQIVAYLIYSKNRRDIDLTHLYLIFDIRDNTLVGVKPDGTDRINIVELIPK